MILHVAMSVPKPVEGERQIRGQDLGLPLVERLGAINSHKAARISWHEHPRFELLCLLDGATAYEFRDGPTVELHGGQFLVVPPNVRHRGVHNVRMPANLCGIVFDPRPARSGINTPFTRSDLNRLAGEFTRHALVVHDMGPELRRLLAGLSRQVREMTPGNDPAAALTLRLQVCATLLEAARQMTRGISGNTGRVVAAARAYMEEHYAEPLPMAALARAAGCGRARLFQLFKQSVGMTPNDFLQRLRVNKARQALANPKLSVTEVALRSGFSSSQYFSSVFRRYTGMTPSAARLQAGLGRFPAEKS